MRKNPLLLIDFYKACHAEQYPKGLTTMVSYYTPRMSRLADTDRVTLFGLQGFIKEYLIDMFNECFFDRELEEVIDEYNRVLTATLGEGSYDGTKIAKLHELGFLPLAISAIPEGTRTKIGVPQIEIMKTHPEFVWVVNAIETMMSATMWHTQVAAEVGVRYKKIVNQYADMTCGREVNRRRLLGDFSMRGQHSVESATKASAAWLLSFDNTATVPAIIWLEDNYKCDVTKETVGLGAISTEHSVMCSNVAVDGDEITHIKRLLAEIYPNHSFSMVSDSYDYWGLVTELLPQCKKEIMEHNGTLAIRGDSGDPVEIIAGLPFIKLDDEEYADFIEDKEDWLRKYIGYEDIDKYYILNYKDKYHKAHVYAEWSTERGGWTDNDYEFIDRMIVVFEENYTPRAEDMGTVWALAEEFGYTINEKGYKVLDSHVKAIYGDSITPQRCTEIYQRLADKGFSIQNVSLGVGSFSFMCLETIDGEDNVHYNPYTRDTFGIAVKATYAEDAHNNPIMIQKQPKGASWKKSQKGCCIVSDGGQSYTDGHALTEEINKSELVNVFFNGVMIKEYTLKEIRDRLETQI